ncbi:MAG: hypothetical protein OZSIB_2810 [Candidatus Ozemobacter sibiricus]|uniref:Uncharacterized protein n=1 Tax=Candidatus Ozemobacter sibiricus TaxID=2268124 RepID=A0A367ZU84_9BACT|nr:MAG: hypothetical protein OZSIB_2810 [Candidatus Ozemobacter sibiricus]
MRDPLLAGDSPYQVLRVPENATKQAIDAAFKKLLAKGKQVARLREAWNTLSKPVDRTFENIFLYNDHFAKVQPRKLLQQRLETADAFGRIERQLFPHIPSIHSLAILWLRWATYGEDERLAGLTGATFTRVAEFPPETPPVETRWHQAIIRWAMLFPSPQFWADWLEFGRQTGLELSPEELESLKQRLRGYFTSLLYGYQEKYRRLDRASEAAAFQNYEALFASELKLTELMDRIGVTVTIGKRTARVAAGKAFLAHLGLLEAVQATVAERRRADPANAEVQALQTALSPLGEVQELLDHKKFAAVLTACEALPAPQRQTPEVRRLQGQALLGLGHEKAQAGQLEEAFALWQKGMVGGGPLAADCQAAIVAATRERASALQQHDLEGALRLVERSLALVKSPELDEVRSSLLAARGIRLVDEGFTKTKEARGPTGEALRREGKALIERGLNDLKLALEANPKNERAREQFELARHLLADLDLFPIIDDLEAKRYDQAVPKLKAFLLKNPQHQKAREMLEFCRQFQCWFCDSPTATDASAAEQPMHLVEGREGNTVYIKVVKVPIPRCATCQAIHAKVTWVTIGSFLVFAALWLAGVFHASWASREPGPFMAMAGVIALALWFLTSYTFEQMITSKAGIKPESEGKEHPRCLALVSQGWAYGEKPPNTR